MPDYISNITTLQGNQVIGGKNFDGDYKIDGQKVNDLNDEEKANTRKEFISYVHQKPVLLNDFSVFDNVKLFSEMRHILSRSCIYYAVFYSLSFLL